MNLSTSFYCKFKFSRGYSRQNHDPNFECLTRCRYRHLSPVVSVPRTVVPATHYLSQSSPCLVRVPHRAAGNQGCTVTMKTVKNILLRGKRFHNTLTKLTEIQHKIWRFLLRFFKISIQILSLSDLAGFRWNFPEICGVSHPFEQKHSFPPPVWGLIFRSRGRCDCTITNSNIQLPFYLCLLLREYERREISYPYVCVPIFGSTTTNQKSYRVISHFVSPDRNSIIDLISPSAIQMIILIHFCFDNIQISLTCVFFGDNFAILTYVHVSIFVCTHQHTKIRQLIEVPKMA